MDLSLLPFACVFAALGILGCGLSHPDPSPDLEDPPPPAPEESRFYIATAPDGLVHLVRLDAATGEFEIEGEPLWTTDVRAVHYLGQDAASGRALVNDAQSNRAYALQGGVWVELCAGFGLDGCYVQGASRTVRFFALHPHYEETDPRTRFVDYGGDVLGTHDGWPTWMVAWGGDEPWALRGSVDPWTLHYDAGAAPMEAPFVMRDAELPRRAFANHVLTQGRDDRQFRYYGIPSAELQEPRCADGSSPTNANDAMIYAGCADQLVQFGDGELLDLGVRLPDGEALRGLLHVEPGSYQVFSASQECAELTALRIFDAGGRALSSVERTPTDYPPAETGETLPCVGHRSRGLRADPTSTVVVAHFWAGVPAHELHIVEDEHVVVVLEADGEVSLFPIEMEGVFGPPWLPDSTDTVYWVDDGRLLALDYRSGEARRLDRGWTFHYL